ncbi:hypothetical protein PTTG_26953 [Puccinia triticina 1-1 BBBD Race 1]|uniref:DUF659 domain-containing protein n=1 Tax=Puccinia triticina (isolate 1-1 / race 1 (BBBD)) TaxID=630390 RepID=A0A180GNW2_PUCT1|nr:hypothetical protein PTTG_26953 [Puccinia triticina 1-1 BBBD Race 1]
MAPPTRKRRRPIRSESSPSSSRSESWAPLATQESKSKSDERNDDNERGQSTSREDLITPSSTQPLSGINRQESDDEELRRAKRVAANALSSCYKSYLVPELSDQLDKNNRRMIAYPCTLCGTKINRPTSDLSCSNLIKHAANCLRKHNEQKSNSNLARFGIKGTGDIDPKEVPQLCAVWCAEAARPFSALVDASHQAILHPTVVKNLPTRQVVSNDIHRLYLAIQRDYKSVLEAHKGALYLGVDSWQSPNAFDILGIVIYRLAGEESGDPKLEAMPLDFVRLSQRHTGEYLAETVRLVVEKFGIQYKICGIVSNNASNNLTMVRELKKQKWVRFKGEPQWVRCFAHVLNLIVQGILRPFGNSKQNPSGKNQTEPTLDDSESDDDDNEGRIILQQDIPPCSKSERDDESEIQSCDEKYTEDSEQLSLEDIENASEEEECDCYTTQCCKVTLAKFCAIAKKLNYSPNSKAEFIEICRKKACETPHTVERDVQTRWNSTLIQVKSILRCQDAIIEWQRHKRHGIDWKFHLDKSDFDLAHDLAEILNLFYEITHQILISGSARLSNIVMYIDQITDHLSTAITGSHYPPAMKNACQIGLKITNKYYSLTDSSPLYRIAILLHPSFRDEYFKLL